MTARWSQESYIKAYRFAAQAHRGQLVPGTNLPYIMHLSFVAMEVMAADASWAGPSSDRHGRGSLDARSPERPLAAETFDGNLAIQVALLHDVLEDTRVRFDEVREGFGEAVASGVLALTKDMRLPRPQRMPDCLRRIRERPREVWMVKLADRITNLQRPPTRWSQEKIRAYQVEAREIYEALHEASPFLGQRLLHKIVEYAGYMG